MIRQLLLGSATLVLVTGSASALTMSVNEDNRNIHAEAAAGLDFDSNSASPAFAVFDESVSASAAAVNPPLTQNIGSGGGGGNGFYGAVANASANQFSEIGAMSIYGSGFAEASGNHGHVDLTASFEADGGAGGGGGRNFDSFEASAQSVIDVVFSIDEAAYFDLSGFLSAGNELAEGPIGNDITNVVSVVLYSKDTEVSSVAIKISNDSTALDESGVLEAGQYQFSVRASAGVLGHGEVIPCLGCSGIDAIPTNGFGYATSAGFRGVTLDLSAIDKPIPEPVTTTLAAMGLGALVLRTSRRRHS